jgi:ATP-binding cassette subfamily B (MDR/TAP) protein 1
MLAGVAISLYKGADFAGICATFIPVILMVMAVFGN